MGIWITWGLSLIVGMVWERKEEYMDPTMRSYIWDLHGIFSPAEFDNVVLLGESRGSKFS